MMDVGIGNSFERGLICYAADAATGSGMEVEIQEFSKPVVIVGAGNIGRMFWLSGS
jgi:hypothetical protein